MTFVDAYLRERSEALGLRDLGLAEPWSTLLVTPWFAGSRHVIGLVHAGGTGEMKVVVKLPRRPGDDGGIAKEAGVLRELERLAPAVAARAPRVLALDRLGSQSILVETAVGGELLGPEVVRADADRALREGCALIRALPLTGRAGEEPEWFARLLGDPLERFLVAVGDPPELRGLVRRTLAHLEPLREAPLPFVFEHGDLGHPNLILRPDGKLAAIDWERAEPRGLPLHDLAFHLAYLAEAGAGVFDRVDQLAVFDATFLRRPGAWGRRVLAQELERLELDRALLAPLVLASWARSAAGFVARLCGDDPAAGAAAGRRPGPEAVLAAVTEDRDFALWRHVEASVDSLREA